MCDLGGGNARNGPTWRYLVDGVRRILVACGPPGGCVIEYTCQPGATRAVIISTAGRSAVGAVNWDEILTRSLSLLAPAGSNRSMMPTPKSLPPPICAQAGTTAQSAVPIASRTISNRFVRCFMSPNSGSARLRYYAIGMPLDHPGFQAILA